MVLTAYFALSPVTGLSCHRRPQETCKKLASRELDASVGASGPHDFAVRLGAARPRKVFARRRQNVHRIPRPTSVTIATRPSCGCGTAKMLAVIWGKDQCCPLRHIGTTGKWSGLSPRNHHRPWPVSFDSCTAAAVTPLPAPQSSPDAAPSDGNRCRCGAVACGSRCTRCRSRGRWSCER